MMNKFIRYATETTPDIYFSPEENRFEITGKSAPEDVRGLYYPVVEWMNSFTAWVREENQFTEARPLVFKVDLEYFNSSSAKFLFDIFNKLRDLNKGGLPVIIEWYFEAGDSDLREAGEDLSFLCEMEFSYRPKTTEEK